MNEVIVPFAYADLPAPVAAELQAVTARIRDRLTRQVADIIETGRDLIEVKSKLQHGQFERWLAERTEDEIDQTLRNFGIAYKRLRDALLQAHQSHSNNATLFPRKPWAKS